MATQPAVGSSGQGTPSNGKIGDPIQWASTATPHLPHQPVELPSAHSSNDRSHHSDYQDFIQHGIKELPIDSPYRRDPLQFQSIGSLTEKQSKPVVADSFLPPEVPVFSNEPVPMEAEVPIFGDIPDMPSFQHPADIEPDEAKRLLVQERIHFEEQQAHVQAYGQHQHHNRNTFSRSTSKASDDQLRNSNLVPKGNKGGASKGNEIQRGGDIQRGSDIQSWRDRDTQTWKAKKGASKGCSSSNSGFDVRRGQDRFLSQKAGETSYYSPNPQHPLYQSCLDAERRGQPIARSANIQRAYDALNVLGGGKSYSNPDPVDPVQNLPDSGLQTSACAVPALTNVVDAVAVSDPNRFSMDDNKGLEPPEPTGKELKRVTKQERKLQPPIHRKRDQQMITVANHLADISNAASSKGAMALGTILCRDFHKPRGIVDTICMFEALNLAHEPYICLRVVDCNIATVFGPHFPRVALAYGVVLYRGIYGISSVRNMSNLSKWCEVVETMSTAFGQHEEPKFSFLSMRMLRHRLGNLVMNKLILSCNCISPEVFLPRDHVSFKRDGDIEMPQISPLVAPDLSPEEKEEQIAKPGRRGRRRVKSEKDVGKVIWSRKADMTVSNEHRTKSVDGEKLSIRRAVAEKLIHANCLADVPENPERGNADEVQDVPFTGMFSKIKLDAKALEVASKGGVPGENLEVRDTGSEVFPEQYPDMELAALTMLCSAADYSKVLGGYDKAPAMGAGAGAVEDASVIEADADDSRDDASQPDDREEFETEKYQKMDDSEA